MPRVLYFRQPDERVTPVTVMPDEEASGMPPVDTLFPAPFTQLPLVMRALGLDERVAFVAVNPEEESSGMPPVETAIAPVVLAPIGLRVGGNDERVTPVAVAPDEESSGLFVRTLVPPAVNEVPSPWEPDTFVPVFGLEEADGPAWLPPELPTIVMQSASDWEPGDALPIAAAASMLDDDGYQPPAPAPLPWDMRTPLSLSVDEDLAAVVAPAFVDEELAPWRWTTAPPAVRRLELFHDNELATFPPDDTAAAPLWRVMQAPAWRLTPQWIELVTVGGTVTTTIPIAPLRVVVLTAARTIAVLTAARRLTLRD